MADILLVEPDQVAADAMAAVLTQHGHEVRLADSVSTAQAALDYQVPDAILTELALPDMDGLVFVSELSRLYPKAALLAMSDRDSRADRVLAFRLGADGFIIKPSEDVELVTRVEAALRRVTSNRPAVVPEILEVDNLLIHRPRGTVAFGGQLLHLTPTEYRLLVVLASRPNEVVTREQLLLDVWGYVDEDVNHMLDVHLSRMRQKFQPDRSPRLITVPRKGLMLETVASQVKEVS